MHFFTLLQLRFVTFFFFFFMNSVTSVFSVPYTVRKGQFEIWYDYKRNLTICCLKKIHIPGRSYTERFPWYDLYDSYSVYDDFYSFKISSYKYEEIELILSFKNCIIQISIQKVVTTFQFTHSDKSNHTKTE